MSQDGLFAAVAGVSVGGAAPRLVVLDLQERKVVAVCCGGTERQFSHVAFSPDDKLLAAVGAAPDYTLSVWQWREEKMLLRAKAFSQDVDTVQFSPFDPERLVTSGTGHIRFWRMADTFTGLKLQGAIGKFGRVDLSDIAGFAMLRDGKVLSTNESGWMLLWEGGHVKVEVGAPGETTGQPLPAHAGGVTTLQLLRGEAAAAASASQPAEAVDAAAGEPAKLEELAFVSCGRDGWLRVWPYAAMDAADTFEDAPRATVQPLVELELPAGCVPVAAVWCADPQGWVVQDQAGAQLLVRAPIAPGVGKADCSVVCSGHGGAATTVASVLPSAALTGARDGVAALWDMGSAQVVARLKPGKRSAAVTTGVPLPSAVAGPGAVALGYADGVVRVVQAVAAGDSPALRRLAAFKPHTGAIAAMAVSPDGSLLLTAGVDGRVFIFQRNASGSDAGAGEPYMPVGFDTLPHGCRVSAMQVREVPNCSGSYEAMLLLDSGVLAILQLTGEEQGHGETGLQLSLQVHAFTVALPDMVPPPTRRELAAAARAAAAAESKQGEEKDGEPLDAEGDEEDEEEEESLDPALLRRSTGALCAALWAPWDAEVSAAAAVSYPVQARVRSSAERNEARVLLAGSGDLRQLLLEVALPPLTSAASTPLATVQPGSAQALPLLCTYANANSAVTVLHHAGQLLLAGAEDGSVTIRHTQHPRAYIRADIGSLQAGGVRALALAGEDRVLVALADGAVVSLHVDSSQLEAAAGRQLAAAESSFAKLSLAPHPYPHDVPMNLTTRQPWQPGDMPGAGRKAGGGGGGGGGGMASPASPKARAASPAPGAGGAVQITLDSGPLAGTLSPADLVGAPVEPVRAAVEESKSAEDEERAASPAVTESKSAEPEEEQEHAAGEAAAPVAQVQHAAEDVDGDTAPSLEGARKAAADQAAAAAANAKQDAMRAKVGALQAEFEALLARVGSNDPAGYPRIDATELIVDPELLALHQTDVESAVAAVERELAWDVEAARLSVQKLMRTFFHEVDTEAFVLKGLVDPALRVESIPCSQLPRDIAQEAEAVHDAAAAADARAPPPAHMPHPSDSTAAEALERDPLAPLIPASACVEGNDYEARRTRRVARRAALAHLENQRPGADDVAPEFAQVLTAARRDVQDHPLKSEEGFTVEAESRMDASKKHAQIVALDAATATSRKNFNDRLKTIRALKLRLSRAVRGANARLREIAAGLQEFVDVPVPDPDLPEYDCEEWPELRRERATAAVLRQLGKPVQRAPMPAAHPHAGERSPFPGVHTGGMGMARPQRVRGWQGHAAYLTVPSVALAVAAHRTAHGMPAMPTARTQGQPAVAAAVRAMPRVQAPASYAVQAAQASSVHHQRLQMARARITQRTVTAVHGFDSIVRLLQRERVLLNRELSAAAAWRLTLQQELRMLRRLARKDSALTDKLNQTMREKSSVLSALAECAAAREEKAGELEQCRAREAQLLESFRDMVPEGTEGGDDLLRIFKRKIKRRALGDADMEDDSDDSNWSSSDEEDSDVEDVCPVGCDQALFDRVLELRETRLDQEEATADVLKALDDIKRAQERHTQRQRQIDKEVTVARDEIAQFQKATQAELNTLEAVLPLRASQLYVGARAVQLLQVHGSPHALRALAPEDARNLTKAIEAQCGQAGLEAAMRAAERAVEDARAMELQASATGVMEESKGNAMGEPSARDAGDLPATHYLIGAAAAVQAALSHVSGVGTAPGTLPATIGTPVLLDLAELQRLQHRVHELYADAEQVHAATKQLTVQRRSMLRRKADIEHGIADLRKKTEDLAFLKFGQMVDMAALDAATGSSAHVSSAVETAQTQAAQHHESSSTRTRLEQANAELVSGTKVNTQLLERIAELTKEQAALERELSAGSGGSSLASLAQPREVVSEAKADAARLQRLLAVQQAEADSLRQEVVVLRSKRSLYSAE